MNGFCLCAAHHVRYTYDPLAWDDYILLAWGHEVYWNLRRMAQKTTPPDVAAALAALRAEADSMGIA
jgi:hypothetical protein